MSNIQIQSDCFSIQMKIFESAASCFASKSKASQTVRERQRIIGARERANFPL